MNWYSFVYGFGVIDLLLLIYLFHRENPDTESKRFFILLGVSSLLWIGAEFLYYTLWGKITQSLYYAKIVGIIFLPYFILMGVLSLPIRSKVLKFRFSRQIFFVPPAVSLIFIFVSPFDHLFIAGFQGIISIDGYIRYNALPGPIFYLWFIPYIYSYLLLSLGILIYNLRHLRTKIDEYLLVILFSAISIPLTMNIYHFLNPRIYPNPTSLAVVFSAALMVYSLLRFKWFSIPVDEKWEVEKDKFTGMCYLVNCGVYKNINDLMKKRNTFVVTTRDPRWIDAGIENSAIWISELDEERTIRPERLEFEIEYSIVEFWRQNPNGIVILEGLTYLRTANPLSKLRFFMKDVSDTAIFHGGTLLVIENELSIFPEDELPLIKELLNGHLDTVNTCDRYGFKALKDTEEIKRIKGNAFLLTSIDPKKIEFNGKYIHIHSDEDMMRKMKADIIYRVEEEFKKGANLYIAGIDNLFIGWDYLEIYRWLKLVLDLARKYGRKIYIIGEQRDEKIRKILGVYS